MNKLDLSPTGDFVQPIWDSLSSYNHSSVDTLVNLKYASRSANTVVDSLAHMNSTISAHKICFNNFPISYTL